MQNLNEMGIFATVAEQGSFTKAANKLGMPKSTVSRHVSQLEERLGERLLNRTTRQMRLTEVGKLYFGHCQRIIEEAESANSVVSSLQAQPSGNLRVTAPLAFGAPFLQDLLEQFLRDFPKVNVELILENRVVDLVGEEIDIAIRVGPLEDSTLVAKEIGDSVMVFCASPSFLEKYDVPKTIEDLQHYELIRHPNAPIVLENGKHYDLRSRFVANDMGVIKDMTVRGFGVGMVPLMLAAEDIIEGRLIPVLLDYPLMRKSFYLVYPSRRQIAAKTLSFINFVGEELKSRKEWNVGTVEFLANNKIGE